MGIAKELVYGVNSVLLEGGLRCHHVQVGEQFHGREFQDLLNWYLENGDGSLPIALYRYPQMTGAPKPYVFTCPPLNTTLHELDNVFMLERDR